MEKYESKYPKALRLKLALALQTIDLAGEADTGLIRIEGMDLTKVKRDKFEIAA